MRRIWLYYILFAMMALLTVGLIKHHLQKTDLPTFKFTIALTANQDDFLMLFYRSRLENFSRARKIKRRVNGVSLNEVEFDLPKGSSNVRLRLSSNKDQSNLTIKQIVVQDEKENRKIIKANFSNYFQFNHFCQSIKETEEGLAIELRELKKSYDPHLVDVNLSYLLYYAR